MKLLYCVLSMRRVRVKNYQKNCFVLWFQSLTVHLFKTTTGEQAHVQDKDE